MSHDLNITIDQTQGGFLRTIGLIERRGFSVLSANLLASTGDAQELTVRVAVRDGDRSIDVLARQIERLEIVRSVATQTIGTAPDMMPESKNRKPGRTMSFARAVASIATRRPVFEDVVT